MNVWRSALSALIGIPLWLIASAGSAQASPIGPDCGSCAGAIYSLTYDGTARPDADPLHETFRITLGIDTNTYTGGGSFLNAVAVKVSSSIFASALVAAPVDARSWTLVTGGTNSGGCSGSGSGFDCAEATSDLNQGKGVEVLTGNGPGTDYSFVFDITVNNGGLLTALDQASIKALYVDASGNKVGNILSENITLQAVPEPGVLAMLGAGLLVVGAWSRRRSLDPDSR